MPTAEYFDLASCPEEYTGYDGSDVWRFIHNRICFNGYEYDEDHWKSDFNRAVSGLHTLVSTQVVQGIETKIANGDVLSNINPKTMYIERISPQGRHPLALENMHFSYMLVLAASSAIRARLVQEAETGTVDAASALGIQTLLSNPLTNPSALLTSVLSQSFQVSDDELWQTRLRCRDLLRVTNCIQCNKCRLHGKVSVLGLVTALRVLCGSHDTRAALRRVDMAALLATMQKFALAVEFCKRMECSLG